LAALIREQGTAVLPQWEPTAFWECCAQQIQRRAKHSFFFCPIQWFRLKHCFAAGKTSKCQNTAMLPTLKPKTATGAVAAGALLCFTGTGVR